MTQTSTATQTLDGRRVMVTGAGAGIGREVAMSAARSGADVIAFSLEGDLDTLGRDVRALGRRYVSAVGDVTKPDNVAAVVAAAERDLGALRRG